MMPRAAGLLLHPTSLPGPWGMGTLGTEARAWVDRLNASGVGYWQILPLGPTGFGHSPYQCYSAFAGNALLIDPDLLVGAGFLNADERPLPAAEESSVDFDAVIARHTQMLMKAHARFRPAAAFDAFCADHAAWLDDYALFMALKTYFNERVWNEWPENIRLREPETLAYYANILKDETAYHRFVQFCFYDQWESLREYANAKGVKIIGDLPIYVAMNSADVWANPEYFELDDDLQPTAVAGVPPDYFSATGQRWGNPLFDWERLEQEGYEWWVARLKGALELHDWVRIDHFRGFEAYWSVPADEETAINGEWIAGPGAKLFDAFRRVLGHDLPIIAEDLGIITPEVEALRDAYGLPGMKILQFAFGSDAGNPYLPHNHIRNCVVYTGTHDNDTTNGWFYAAPPEEAERAHTMRYLHCPWEAFHESLNRTALASTANLAVLPLQDLLGLGSDARMNTPGTAEGNWHWRVTPQQLDNAPWEPLRSMIELYGRFPVAQA
ncbi:4-alpha-glucanotransferase [Sulfurimonas sp. HSL-1656]|uniref:4-alpha-glucanotransferase n=1 Tax=Thiomicrolovo subterrani TaxID=3131934 RepID=UPI0031F854F8